MANHFRTPYGPGWALVGDAGYLKDPVTAQGITDAFLDAERLATALNEVWSAAPSLRRRHGRLPAAPATNASLPIYEFTTQIATLEPPPPELQQLLGAIASNPDAMDEFASVWAGTLSPAAFFDPAHLGQLMVGIT